MKYFRKRGIVYRGSLSLWAGTAALRIGLFLIALALPAALFFSGFPPGGGSPGRWGVLAAIAVLFLVSVISLLIRMARGSSSLTLDPVRSTIAFKPPGKGQRREIGFGCLDRIVVSTLGNIGAFIALADREGKRHVLIMGRDTEKLKLFALELSSLTSLPISEESTEDLDLQELLNG